MRRTPVVIVVDDEATKRALDDPEGLDRVAATENFEAQGMALATYGGHWLYRWLTPWRVVRRPGDGAYLALTAEERRSVDGVFAAYPWAYAVVALAATVPRGRG